MNRSRFNATVGLLAASLVGFTPMMAVAAPDITSENHTSEGTLKQKVDISTDELEAKIREAEEAGVDVGEVQGEEVTVPLEEADEKKAEIEQEYASQIKALDKAIETQKAADAQYAADKEQYDKDKAAFDAATEKYNQAKAQYDKDKAQYDSDKKAYDEALAQFEKDSAAFEQAKVQFEKDTAAYEKAKADYEKKVSDLAGKKDNYDKLLAEYETKYAQYQKDLAAYNAAAKAQSTGADIYKAQTPKTITREQPLEFSKTRNNLVKTDATEYDDKRWDPGYFGSDTVYWKHLKSETDTVTGEWKDVAVDKESGRKLNAKITITDFTFANPKDEKDPNHADRYVMVYPDFFNNFTINGTYSARQTITFYYADNGAKYDKPFYLTAGSLNAQGKQGQRYEFSAPGNGVIATFAAPGTLVNTTAQNVSGGGSKRVKRAFMVTQGQDQKGPIGDENFDAISKLGVTYLVNNGASLWFGTSGSGGKNPVALEGEAQSVTGKALVRATYNHIMLASSTVAPTLPKPKPPVKPTPPDPTLPDEPKPPAPPTPPGDKPEQPTPPTPPTPPGEAPEEPTPPTPTTVDANVRYLALVVEGTDVVKVGDNTDKKVIAGEETTQHITHKVGYYNTEGAEELTSFVLADMLYYTEDGVLPVALGKVTVTNSAGEDVTDQFAISEDDSELDGQKVHRVLAAHNEPASLKHGETYTLNITQVAKDDKRADDEVDRGGVIINGQLIYTDTVTYPEHVPVPKKDVKNKGGVSVDGKRFLAGDTGVYEITINAKDLANTQKELTRLGVRDDYDENFFTPNKEDVSVTRVGEEEPISADEYTISFDDEKGVMELLFKDPAKMAGSDYIVRLPGTISGKVGELKNTALQLTNNTEDLTNEVINPIPEISPLKYVTDVEGFDIDGKRIFAGDVLHYPVIADTSQLTDTAYKAEQMAIVDDYDENLGEALEEDAKIYQLPADVKELDDVEAALKDGATDVTGDFTITDDDDVVRAEMNKNDAGDLALEMGHTYVMVLPFEVTKDLQGEGEIVNVAAQIHNQNTYNTNEVKNPYKPLTPLKYVVNKDGSDVNEKQAMLGDTLYYPVVADTAELNEAAYKATDMAITDDYDETKVDALMDQAKVYRVDSSIARDDLDGVVASFDEKNDVTEHFTLRDEDGVVTASMNKDDDGNLALDMDANYVLYLPVHVKVDIAAEGSIDNTAGQIHNRSSFTTNKVTNPLTGLTSHKDVVTVGTNDSVDGKEITLGADFDYLLASTVRPAGYAGETTQWSITDDFDEAHDTYQKSVITTSTGFVDADGSKVEAGTDITSRFDITVDEATAKVTYEAKPEFLEVLNKAENIGSEQGFEVRVSMNRHAAGENITNTFTETYNGAGGSSNTVETFTNSGGTTVTPPEVPAAGGASASTGGDAIDSVAPWAIGLTGFAGFATLAGLFTLRRKKKS